MCISDTQAANFLAVAKRVLPDASDKQLKIEIAWNQHYASPRSGGYADKKGCINWMSMKLGRMLLDSLAEAQNWRCCYCGVSVLHDLSKQPTLEHVTPKSKNGSDHPDNLFMACKECNSRRGDTDIAVFLDTC